MLGASTHRLAAALCCLAAATAGGCSDFNVPTWVPFAGKISDELPGVATPPQRLAALRKLAGEAAQHSPEEKQQIAQELAQAIRGEQDAMLRAEIITTLGRYPGPTADGVLKAAVNDPDVDVRVAACRAWAKRGGPESVQLLSGMLTGDVDSEVRMAAAHALGQTRDPAAVAALGKALEDPDPAMQYRAVMSLRKVSGEDFGSDVNQWRQYVKGERPKPAQPVSIAEHLRHMF